MEERYDRIEWKYDPMEERYDPMEWKKKLQTVEICEKWKVNWSTWHERGTSGHWADALSTELREFMEGKVI